MDENAKKNQFIDIYNRYFDSEVDSRFVKALLDGNGSDIKEQLGWLYNDYCSLKNAEGQTAHYSYYNEIYNECIEEYSNENTDVCDETRVIWLKLNQNACISDTVLTLGKIRNYHKLFTELQMSGLIHEFENQSAEGFGENAILIVPENLFYEHEDEIRHLFEANKTILKSVIIAIKYSNRRFYDPINNADLKIYLSEGWYHDENRVYINLSMETRETENGEDNE